VYKRQFQRSGPSYFILIKGTFVDLSVGDVITISGTASNNSSFTIESISNDLTGNTDFTLGLNLEVTEVAVLEENVSGVSMTKTSDFLRAERDEAFDVLTGLIAPETSYNVGLNPKYMLANQSLIINSGLSKKAGSETIKVQEVKLNGEMECQFAVGEGLYNLDPDREITKMNADVALDDNNQNNKLWTGNLIKFETKVSYSRFLSWKDKCLNQAVDENYGYLRVNVGGTDYSGWPMLLGHNPSSNKISVLLRQKA
jgi:hypothetical protein